MSVSTTHRKYDKQMYIWKRCRDVVEGREALIDDAVYGGHARTEVSGSLFRRYETGPRSHLRERYIPKLSNQSPEDYLRYIQRASFFNATARTVDALVGLLFAKAPTERLPNALREFAKDITMSGCSLREFAAEIAREEVTVSRVGILVDYPSVNTDGLTVADAQRLNLRPYMTKYCAEQIINWRCEMVNGVKQLTMVVLAEEVEIAKDEFHSECEMRYRVLDLVDGQYRVRIFKEDGETVSESFPTMRGSTIDYIPFLIVSGDEVRKPLILDLVHINVSHYRNSCDYEHGLHFTGLPTPYVAGVQLGEGESLQIGSTSAWVFPDPMAKAEYLEFKGSGLNTLANAMAEKEKRMAVLGAKMLTDESRTGEQFQTVEMRTAGERAVLADVSQDITDSFNTALRWMAEWEGISTSQIDYQINLDFGAHKMEPRMLSELMKAVQADLMPLSVFFDNLKKGEIVSGAMEFEDYEGEIGNRELNLAAEQASVERDAALLQAQQDSE